MDWQGKIAAVFNLLPAVSTSSNLVADFIDFEYVHVIILTLWLERLPTGVPGKAEWPAFFDNHKQV
jgi:hypothetical protein